MLPVLTAAEMRQADQKIINEIGLPSLVLMENAARGVLEHIGDWLHASSRVIIYAGPGNNGGDGLAIARQLLDRDYADISVCMPLGEAKLSEDCRAQLSVLKKLSASCFVTLTDAASRNPSIVIDALLGTGAKSEIAGELLSAVEQINSHRERGAKVVSVDMPTGLNADTGEADETRSVKAHRTVAIASHRTGFYQRKASAVTGEIRLAKFGFPLLELVNPNTWLVESQDVIGRLPQQNDQASKFTNGRVFALAGSRGMTGAAIMCATSALRAGCGLVNVAVPESERSLVAQAMPELLTVGCSETEEGYPNAERYDLLEPHIDHADAILIGPGLRKAKGPSELMLKIMTEVQKPMVIDAGALATLQGDPSPLKQRKAPTIITPHSGELSRLNGVEWSKVEDNRLEYAREIAQKFNVIVISKGAPTYTIAPDGKAYVNSTGNAGLATAGSGDVLAGIVVGMLVQMPYRALDAAIVSVYVHGLAGDLAAKELTKISMTAMDVNRFLPNAYKSLGCK